MKKAHTKGHTLHGPSYVKRSEQANPRGQKVDSWCPGAGGGTIGTKFLSGVMEIFWNGTVVTAARHSDKLRTAEARTLKW